VDFTFGQHSLNGWQAGSLIRRRGRLLSKGLEDGPTVAFGKIGKPLGLTVGGKAVNTGFMHDLL
jgi:hypothetical protein